MKWEGEKKGQCARVFQGQYSERFFPCFGWVQVMLTILSADQQAANVAAVSFITGSHISAGSKQIQSMAGIVDLVI